MRFGYWVGRSSGRAVTAVRVVQQCGRGHVRGADPVAVRDRGQPLHRGAEEACERLRLRLAQLRELSGHVGYRAVMLAQLLATGCGGVGTGYSSAGTGWIPGTWVVSGALGGPGTRLAEAA